MWKDLTRRQQIWLLDRQAELVAKIADEHAATIPEEERGRMGPVRLLADALAIPNTVLMPRSLLTRPLSAEDASAIERAAGMTEGALRPYALAADLGDLPHPDLDGLCLWEGRDPEDDPQVDVSGRKAFLREVIGNYGATRVSLARATGLSDAFLSVVLNDDRKGTFRLSTIARLAHALDLPIGQVVVGRGSGDVGDGAGPPPADEPAAATVREVPEPSFLVRTPSPSAGVPCAHVSVDPQEEPSDAMETASERAGDALSRARMAIECLPGQQTAYHEDDRAAQGHLEYRRRPEGCSVLDVLGRTTRARADAVAEALGEAVDFVPDAVRDPRGRDEETGVLRLRCVAPDAVVDAAYRELLRAPAPRRTLVDRILGRG